MVRSENDETHGGEREHTVASTPQKSDRSVNVPLPTTTLRHVIFRRAMANPQLLVGLLALATSCRAPAPITSPAPLPQGLLHTDQLTLFDGLAAPVPGGQAVGAPPPALFIPGERPYVRFEPFIDAIRGNDGTTFGERVDVSSLATARGPWARVEPDGRLNVFVDTMRPMAGGRIEIGTRVRGRSLARPLFRAWTRLDVDGTRMSASYRLFDLLKPKYDVNRQLERGRGMLTYRVRLLDPTLGLAHDTEERVGFRCEPVPCTEGARFVQLPTITVGPFVDLLTPDSATISFDTDVRTNSRVVLIGGDGARHAFDGDTAESHEVPVTGLAPGTRYRTFVGVRDHRGELFILEGGVFETPPRGAHAFSFAVLSDARFSPGGGDNRYEATNRLVLERLLADAHRRGVALVMMVGDLTQGYTTLPNAFRREMRAYKQAIQLIGGHVPIYEVVGNHDMVIDAWSGGWSMDRKAAPNSTTLFAESFVNPRNAPNPKPGEPSLLETVYSFDHGHAHFAVVNSNYFTRSHPQFDKHPGGDKGYREGYLTEEQIAWLDADLAAARSRGQTELFVFTHEPAFPNGGHAKDAMYYHGAVPEVLKRRDDFWLTLVRHRARAAFFGDEHNYSRAMIDESVDPRYTHPITSVVTGGGGAPYYAQDRSVPWASAVRSFEFVPHYVRVEFVESRVTLETISVDGEVIDRAELRPAAERHQ